MSHSYDDFLAIQPAFNKAVFSTFGTIICFSSYVSLGYFSSTSLGVIVTLFLVVLGTITCVGSTIYAAYRWDIHTAVTQIHSKAYTICPAKAKELPKDVFDLVIIRQGITNDFSIIYKHLDARSITVNGVCIDISREGEMAKAYQLYLNKIVTDQNYIQVDSQIFEKVDVTRLSPNTPYTLVPVTPTT